MKTIRIEMLDTTPVGPITVVTSDKGALLIEIGRDISAWEPALRRYGFIRSEGSSGFRAAAELAEYFRGERKGFDLPVDWALTTPFQRTVLEAVARVPYGETSTYGAIAQAIGNPKTVRAVGRANATNPLTIVLPCHRLIGADGALRGYRAPEGIRTKAWLIAFERDHR